MNIFDFDVLTADIPRHLEQQAWREYFYALQDELADGILRDIKRKNLGRAVQRYRQLGFYFPETAAWVLQQHAELDGNVVPNPSLVWQARTPL